MEAFRLRIAVSFAANHGKRLLCCNNAASRRLLSRVPVATVGLDRGAHTQNIHENMVYISNDKVKLKADPSTMKLNQNIDKPLCIIMNWMMAKPNHVDKYAKLYLDHGFDVVSVSCSPWQLMWPVKGSQVIAEKLLRFMEVNSQNPLVIHGFSVGAYVWAELLVHAVNNKKHSRIAMEAFRLRIAVSFAANHGKRLLCCNNAASRRLLSRVPVATVGLDRGAHTQNIHENMVYISNDKVKLKADPSTMKLNQNIDKPLCIIMNWMMAKPNHVDKYAKLYLDHGFDVVSVSCSPWQLMWPVKGSQVIAEKLLRFMEVNSQNPLVIHGFSVGAYVWAELLVHAVNNKKQFQPVLDRIASQVWDSGADIHEIPVGFPSAVFPRNKFLQELFRSYIKTHMKVFHNVATKHYMKATEVFHETPCRAPGLFLVSKTDLVGAEKRSRSVHDSWVRRGMKCNFKCWDKSPHVLHYIKHPEEYKQVLYSHLDECGLLKKLQ